MTLRSRRLPAVAIAVLAVALLPAGATAEQSSSQTRRAAAGYLDAGGFSSCVVTAGGNVKCWGAGGSGRLGYGNETSIGDNETPAAVGVLSLGRKARAVAVGNAHACALLANGSVRCWGWSANGELGLGRTDPVGDNELPSSVGTVPLGAGRTARAISAGDNHTCVILDNRRVKCWGAGAIGRLGYGNEDSIGDNETAAAVGTVDLGAGRTARAISAGRDHTCAILDTGAVRCWGEGAQGRLGYGNQDDVGDNETPGSVGPVGLGTGRTAKAISAGGTFTCAILDTNAVRCWGWGMFGALGYGNPNDVGDNEAPGSAGPVDLGPGRTARAIASGLAASCAILDTGALRCWGDGLHGVLGYGNEHIIGDNETPGAFGPVALGAGRTARAVSVGDAHTCALLDNAALRCWGDGFAGQLGLASTDEVGDNELPTAVGPISLGALMATRAKTTLTRTATPARDRAAPFRFVVSGLLKGVFAPDAVTCAGAVKLVAKQRSTVAGSARATLSPKAAGCAYRARLTTKSSVRGALTVTASFAGSGNLRPAKAKALTLRAG